MFAAPMGTIFGFGVCSQVTALMHIRYLFDAFNIRKTLHLRVRCLLLCLLFTVSILIDTCKTFCLCVCYSQMSVLTEKVFCLCVCYLQMYIQMHKTLLLCFVFANTYIKGKQILSFSACYNCNQQWLGYLVFVFTQKQNRIL